MKILIDVIHLDPLYAAQVIDQELAGVPLVEAFGDTAREAVLKLIDKMEV